MNLGERIYKLRTEKNLSQEELADALEVSRQSVSKWETNASVPELDKLVKLSEQFGISLDALILNKEAAETKVLPEPQVIYVERSPSASPRRIAGAIILCFAALVWLTVSLFGDMAAGLVLSLPFLACGLICLFVPENTGLLCAWTVYLMVELYLRFATGINWHYVFYVQVYTGIHAAQLMIAWGLLAAFMLLLSVTVWRFRKSTPAHKKRDMTAAGIAWVVYILGWLINIPPYSGNHYDINSLLMYRMVSSVTNWVRNIALTVALLFTARIVLFLVNKRKEKSA